MSDRAAALAEGALAADGLLAEHLPGFQPRPQQQAMAGAVARAIASDDILICEAGTGTGKTFAYLVPAMLSGRKIIISTGTRNLQDQLFGKDIPLVREALGAPISVALLKGRSNYLCRQRLELAQADPRGLRAEVRRDLRAVRDWATVTRAGDIAELALPEDAAIWPLVTSTTDNCLGQDCPALGDCHLIEARRRAQEADLVVVNHHLLCADIALRDEGFGEVLPEADAILVDEAHQLPEIAGSFFGQSVGSRQLQELLRDLGEEYQREAGDLPEIPPLIQAVKPLIDALRLSFGIEQGRLAWREVADLDPVKEGMEALLGALQTLDAALDPLEGRGKGLDHCRFRLRTFIGRLRELGLTEEGAVQTSPEDRASGVAASVSSFDPDADQDGGPTLAGQSIKPAQVRWLDLGARSFRLNQTPLEVADIFADYRERHPMAWVLTSATLAVSESFKHFSRQLGVEQATTALWDSPFDYPSQALWFVPRGLPDPMDADYNARVALIAEQVLAESRGRAFLLFTSHRALQEAARRLEGRIDYPLLVQGSAPRADLLSRFRDLGNAVLLGTSSFWEGVDVRGEALSCVIIDKLPFASPADPIVQARLEAMRERGGNPFRDYQLPQAVIALKQGAGRLIRDANDRGLLVVCDPRLLGRSYGHAFLKSLPPMGRTRDFEQVRAFFAEEAQ